MSDQAKTPEADFVMPVVDYQDERAALEKPRRPRSLTGKRIALLPNFRVISPAFMQALADNIQSRTDVASAYFKKTPEWPFNHAQRMGEIASEIDEAARGCDLMICGVGD
jgi:hypothetical protein